MYAPPVGLFVGTRSAGATPVASSREFVDGSPGGAIEEGSANATLVQSTVAVETTVAASREGLISSPVILSAHREPQFGARGYPPDPRRFAMKRLLALAVAAAPCVFAPPAHAMTVDEIVARNVQAHGGAERLHAIQSIRTTSKGRFGGGDFTVEMTFVGVTTRSGHTRSEGTWQSMTSVDAFDGHDGWRTDPFGGRRDPFRISADEAKGMAHDADLDGPLVDWQQKGNHVEYLGTEDIDGTLAHKLRITRKDGDFEYDWLDPDAMLEIRGGAALVHPRRRADQRERSGRLRAGRRRVDALLLRLGGEGRTAHVALDRRARRGQRRGRRRPLRVPRRGDQGRARARLRHAVTGQRPGSAHAVDDPCVRRRRRVGPARAQHRLGHDERPHLGRHRLQHQRPDHALRGRGLGRRVEVRRRRARPSTPSSTGRACSRSAPSPSTPRTGRTSGSAPARRGRATRRPSATASTGRPTAARRGPTWGCPSPSASCASSCTPTTATWSTPACRASSGATAPTEASTRPSTAARRGRWC